MSGRRAFGGWVGHALVAVALAVGGLAATATPGQAEADQRLYLVTLAGPGLSGGGSARQLHEHRQRVLAVVGRPQPAYTWRHALNGFAVRLTSEQAGLLASRPDVHLVERNTMLPLASTGASSAAGAAAPAAGQGGAGTVIGVVDSGIDPDSRLFADTGNLGPEPRRFRGRCAASDAPDWDAASCNRKLVGADWFVEGFGRHNLRTSSSLSPRDRLGHGTHSASIAAGNPGVDATVAGERLGAFGGAAPRARVAAYKACWSAPDPDDDGCATADLVAAIDQATHDRVDVLSLGVAGPPEFDTVERALLGAAEADIVVVAPAGNHGRRDYAAHPSPWVTTVGATTSPVRRGEVVADSGAVFGGVMVSTRRVRNAPLVRATEAAAFGVGEHAARTCAPGSLDAAETRGAIVVCERGRVGRVDKSRTVQLADGAGMVLVNNRPGPVTEDLHRVPTVHLDQREGRRLLRWSRRNPGAEVTLRPAGVERGPAAVAPWSQHGGAAGPMLKPDVVAPGSGVLAGSPARGGDVEWQMVTGTSAASAATAGVAARLLSRRDLGPSEVRSALTTTTWSTRGGSVLAAGAGRVNAAGAEAQPLVHPLDVRHYRPWLEGELAELNVPSILLADGQTTAERTVTSVARRPLYFSLHARGFDGPVRVTPRAFWLRPGESASYRVEATLPGNGRTLDDGMIVIRSARGHVTRVPVAVTR